MLDKNLTLLYAGRRQNNFIRRLKMKQGTKKKLAVITMSTVMAACVAGGVGYATVNLRRNM